jgi:arylsulfatase A-like enzyme
LGAQGTVFERAYSVSNWTRPAVASLHNSTMPSRHGANDVDLGLSPSLPLMAQVFKGMGYQNVFVTMGVQVQPEDGYGRGVDHFYYARPRGAAYRSALMPFFKLVSPAVHSWIWAMIRGRQESSSPRNINAQALALARQLEPDRPVFMYVHYEGAHTPYASPPPYNKAFTNRSLRRRPVKGLRYIKDAKGPLKEDLKYWIAQYDGQILWHDVYVKRLLDGLRALNRLDNAIVVVIADHGEGFGEHGVWDHGQGLFEEIVRVPLIFWTTQPWNKAQRLQVPASLLDVAPTLVDLAGGKAPAEWDGGSLVPWLRGERQDTDRVVFQENIQTKELGLRNGEWAYFERGQNGEVKQWLYRAEDRRQEHELSSRYPDLVEEFHLLLTERARIDKERGAGAPRVEIDAAREEMLKEMGYVK